MKLRTSPHQTLRFAQGDKVSIHGDRNADVILSASEESITLINATKYKC